MSKSENNDRLLVYADDASTDINTRRLTFGGKLVVLDIDFTLTLEKASIAPISKITVSIPPADNEAISSLGPAAAEVLIHNFQSQDGDNFVRNLTNLAKWDGCSEPPNEGLNCFAVLKGVEDALELIYGEERKSGTEKQVLSKGWGKPTRNQGNLVGLSIQYWNDALILLGAETRRRHYMHPRLQTTYLSAEEPFTNDEMEMFPTGLGSGFLKQSPNWVELNIEGDLNLIHGALCSFVMDLSPDVVVSVEAAMKICEIVGYVGWTDTLDDVLKDEWILKDTVLEDLLVYVFTLFTNLVWKCAGLNDCQCTASWRREKT
jgi:Mediator of RNA polymerase II transcription subunit 1